MLLLIGLELLISKCLHRPLRQVVVSASRLDVRYAILKPLFHSKDCVGLMVMQPDKTGPDGTLSRCSAVRNQSQVRFFANQV